MDWLVQWWGYMFNQMKLHHGCKCLKMLSSSHQQNLDLLEFSISQLFFICELISCKHWIILVVVVKDT